MEPKSGLEIAFSPEFLTIMPVAVIIDVVGIVLVIFALDDFGITDIIGWATIGTWGFLRSQIVPESTAQMPSGAKQEFAKDIRASQQTEKAAQEATKAQKMSKSAKWAKRIRWLEFIPYVGALPLWSVSVYMTIKYS